MPDLMTMLRHRRRSRDRSAGQALVEFALVAPIFFLLVFTVIQLGIVFGAQNALVNGARDAARKAATYRVNEASFDDAGTKQAICNSIAQTLRDSVGTYPGADTSPTALTPTITYEWELNMTGTAYSLIAHVHASYDHPLYVPLVSHFLDSSDGNPANPDGKLTLIADERMRIENPGLDIPTSTAVVPC